jgi:hypothetical protein
VNLTNRHVRSGLAFLHLLEAAPGYSFDDTLTGAEARDSREMYKGTHGYLPTSPEMRASLIIYGAGARSCAKIPLARNCQSPLF